MLIALYSYYRPICLLLIAVLGLACGHLIDTLLQLKLRPEPVAESAVEAPAAKARARTVEADLNLILQNNIFDAGNRSATARMSGGGVNADGGAAPAAPRADVQLLGAVVAGEYSRALLQVNRELQLYRLGEDVPGAGTLEEITRSQVTLKGRDGRSIILTLYDRASAAMPGTPSDELAGQPRRAAGASPSPTARGAEAGSGKSGAGADDAGEIRAVGENRWLVSRETVASVRENFAAQLRLAQMQPRLVNGKTDGFLIQRLNPKSLLAKMGLQRGDVVIDVNNINLDSPEKALQIFQQLREARQISLSIERNGSPMSFAYEIE